MLGNQTGGTYETQTLPFATIFTFGLYVFIAVINLTSALFFCETLRKFSKACLMPALICLYLQRAVPTPTPIPAPTPAPTTLTTPQPQSQSQPPPPPPSPPLPAVVLALVFCWLGDLLLINKDNLRFFKLGLVAFLLGHLAYSAALLQLTTAAAAAAARLNVPVLAGSGAVAVCAGVALFRYLKPDRAMRVPVVAYEVVILGMSMCALQYVVFGRGEDASSVLVFVGSLVFVFSDSVLARLSFRVQGKPKHFNFVTMVPYVVAQGCMAVGFVLV